MSNFLLKGLLRPQMFLKALLDENGQDLVEYAAVISLVVLGITVGMTTLANGINNAMSSVSTAINTTIG